MVRKDDDDEVVFASSRITSFKKTGDEMFHSLFIISLIIRFDFHQIRFPVFSFYQI